MHYLGIDVHNDESHVAVLDDDGEVTEEIPFETVCTTFARSFERRESTTAKSIDFATVNPV
jgi:hypothetical protein